MSLFAYVLAVILGAAAAAVVAWGIYELIRWLFDDDDDWPSGGSYQGGDGFGGAGGALIVGAI